jgi:hypothetical protein
LNVKLVDASRNQKVKNNNVNIPFPPTISDIGSTIALTIYKRMLRRFPTLQVATTSFSCVPPEVNLAAIVHVN